ncbi:phage tail spike protein [Staphylococcus hominis]|uniref:phage tail spike protein n=1 Tax=Staphylococcus hominis TaxID=1290 RepID=UPI00119EF3F0|nr:phage tail spike protein [Staphylococcus hominis]
MKNVGIHVLDFNDNIIDFISQSDGALINAEMSMNVEEKTETFDFTIENTRAEKLRERNRIIAQDNNGTFREFIIIHITDNFDGTTEIECNASYLEDLKTAKPIKPGKFEAHTTTQALLKTLADTGWEVSDDTEYGGNRTTSWTSHTNPFDLIYMLCTTYDMVPSFYIELGAHTVEHRYVSITKPKNLFKGKEITKGKDLTGMTRTIDLSEVKTALLAIGPEKEDGSRIETVVVDDEAQEIFGLPNRYIWDVYEPESNDENMTLKRLTTLAKTELNKRNQAAISYEVSSLDIHKYYSDVTVHLRDIVRVKDRDFRPPLYIEAEVIGIKYNWLVDESEFTFGNVIEYEETKLREFFNKRLDEITKKLNDSISNVNTIVSDVVAGEMEYYERKIFKGTEPPENPQNDTLWYDTSNPDVAVLRRYWNGKWITQTADDVEKIGGLRREQVMYRDLNNSFINLTIQHSKLQNDVYDVLNSEYLVDDDLKANLNQALLDVDSVYKNIKTNLDSMDEDTATIGKLVDTQTLFTVYREKLQTLYKFVTDAKISIDKRLKLLQSQYTDEKFNDAMDKIAQTLPNGRWDSENQQLYADIPNRTDVDKVKQALQDYTDDKISDLNSVLGKEIESKINNTENKLSASISSVERKIDGIEVGGRNLLLGTLNYEYGFNSNLKSFFYDDNNKRWLRGYYNFGINQTVEVEKDKEYTISFTVKPVEENSITTAFIPIREEFENQTSKWLIYKRIENIGEEQRLSFTIKPNSNKITLFFLTSSKDVPDLYYTDLKLEKGKVATDWTPAPEDIQRQIQQAQENAQTAAKAYAKAQDDLKETEIKAYADGVVNAEEQRAIADAIAKRDEAKTYADQKAQEAQEVANQNTINKLTPITTRVTKNETDISELDTQISLMAKSDDVAQKLRDVDGRLTPLETTVKSNKATLDILPTQIDSKVSKQDYTTDKNNIVQRLDNADSERKQLSNEITDKVTITKFESGMTEAKNYTDNVKREATTYTDNKVNNLSVGGRNLLLGTLNYEYGFNSNLKSFFYDENNKRWLRGYYNFSINQTVEVEKDKEYTISFTVKPVEENSITTAFIPIREEFENQTSKWLIYKRIENIGEEQRLSFTIKPNSNKITLFFLTSSKDVPDLYYTDLKLEKGKVATDWTPAPEDIDKEILNSNEEVQKAAKEYTDAYKHSNDIAMTKLETSVSQLDGKVSIKVDEQKFNASQKTLSQVISEITATTKGIYLNYDENGSIQSYFMDRNGIQLRGDKVDITVNKDFNVVANRIDDKVGKNEIINRLNLSPEGLDINVNNIGIRGGDSVEYIDIRNNSILSYGSFTRTWANETDTANLRLGIQSGTVKVQNRTTGYNLYLTEKGLSTMLAGAGDETAGTLEFHSTKYNDRSRGVRLHSTYGAVALESDYSRIILNANLTVNIESNYGIYFRPYRDNRTGNNEFAMYVKENDSGAYTDGVIKYGNVSSDTSQYGSGIRFSKSSINSTIYATNKDGDIGTGHFFGDKLYGDLTAKGSNAYILVEDALRITDKKGYNNGKVNYKDLQCLDVQANSIRVNTARDFYIGVSSNELRVTNNLFWNGGDTGYKPVRASAFNNASLEQYKTDIKKWDYDALTVIANDLDLYQFKYKNEEGNEKGLNHRGVIIGKNYKTPDEFIYGDGVNIYEMVTWALRAIQQLNEKINTLEEQLNEQSITS